MKTRESRYVKVARIAYHLTQEALPRYSHPKSPHHFTLPQLAACVLLMYYLDFSYRDMEKWLLATDQVSQALELPRIPDHTTLQRTYKKLHMLDFEKMKNQLLDENGVEEEGIASDSTGFSPGQASRTTKPARGASTSVGRKGCMQSARPLSSSWHGARAGDRAAMWLICLGCGRCPPVWALPGQAQSLGDDGRCGL